MTEHRIRLRGAWDFNFEGDETAEAGSVRVDLPIRWPAEARFPARLVRRFGRPPFDPATEIVSLELVNVPGLRSIKLNGNDLALPEPHAADYAVDLGRSLLPRNALLLELNEEARSSEPTPWGEIALRIGAREKVRGD